MVRFLILAALNFSLPFLGWWAWQLACRMWLKRRNQPAPASACQLPWVKLLLTGVVLLAISLLTLRLLEQPQTLEVWRPASKAQSQNY